MYTLLFWGVMKTTRDVVDLYCITYVLYIYKRWMHCVCIERVLYLQWGATFTNQQVMCIVASICEDAFIVFQVFLFCMFLWMCVYCIQFMDIHHSQSTCHTCCSTSCRPGSGLSIHNSILVKFSFMDCYLSCFVKNKRILARQLVGHSWCKSVSSL